MERIRLEDRECPLSATLGLVGEWWTLLILHDAFDGYTRFDQFQKSLSIAPNMLTRRLNGLVKAGLLTRCRYSEGPPRYEYLLTPRGRDFRPVIVALMTWGNRHFAPEGASARLVHARSGKPADPVLVDRRSGRRITARDFVFAAGPAANERVRARFARQL